MKRKTSLSRQMFRAIACLLTATQLLLTLLCILFTVRTSRQRTLTDQKNLLSQASVSLGNLASEFKRVVYYLSGDQMIPQTLEEASSSPTYALTVYSELRDRFYTYTSAPITSYKLDYFSYLFLSEQFPVASRMRRYLNLSTEVLNYADVYRFSALEDRPWLEKVLENNRMLYCFVDPEAPDYLFFANEIRNINISDVRFSKDLGVALFQVKKRAVLEYLKELRSISGAQALLMDGETVLLSTDESLFPSGQSLPERCLPALRVLPGEGLSPVRCGSQSYYAAQDDVNRQLTLLLLIPSAQLGGTSQMLAVTLAGVGVSLLLLSLVLSRLVAGRVARPIQLLTQRMKQAPLEVTSLPADVPEQTSQELQALYESYDQMIATIHNLMQTQQRHLRDRQRAELRAMQAQINPHFIHNTLDTVNALALLGGQEEISDLVSELSELLKYTMRFQRQSVALEMELRFVEKYARIQKIRLDHRFSLENRVGEEFLRYQVPRLSLQPLVENAIFYASSEAPIRILLTARQAGNSLEVRVSDNGTHCPAQRLNDYLSGAKMQVSGEGVGVRNVHERIRLQYGEGYGLRYEQNEQGGLTAVVTLPLLLDRAEGEDD